MRLILALALTYPIFGEIICPNEDYTFCAYQGEQCLLDNSSVIAIGAQDLWYYEELPPPFITNNNITCDASYLSKTALQGARKMCCIQTSPPVVGANFTYAPVIDTISCNEQVKFYGEDGSSVFYQFTIDSYTSATFSNCESSGDFEHEIYIYTDQEEQLIFPQCEYGSECGPCHNIEYQAEFTAALAPGTYYIEAEADEDMPYVLDVMCESTVLQCPSGFTKCADEGDNCTLTAGYTVAFGAGNGNEFTYMLVNDTQIMCDAETFYGDPAPASPKICCTSDTNMNEPFLDGPVIGTVQCGETVTQIIVNEDYAAKTYWKLELTEQTLVNFDNCQSYMDTEMDIVNGSGYKYLDNDIFEECDGNDCGWCEDADGEEFTQIFPAGTYYIEAFNDDRYTWSPNGYYWAGNMGQYVLQVQCEAMTQPSCPEYTEYLCDEGEKCNAGKNITTVMYGYAPPMYAARIEQGNFTCDDRYRWNDPAPLVPKQCCISTMDDSYVYYSPVADIVGCDESVETMLTNNDDWFVYKLVINADTTVRFSNCYSGSEDTQLLIIKDNMDITDDIVDCGGYDCGWCYDIDRETYWAELDAGEYYLYAQGDEGLYKLDITCEDRVNKCPVDYTFCANEGEVCDTTPGMVVGMGVGDAFNYIVASGQNVNCTNDWRTFGEELAPAAQAICCTADKNFSDPGFGRDPVVAEITCDSPMPIEFKFTDDNCGPFFVKFDLFEETSVKISNCRSSQDTELYLYYKNGTEFDDPGGCSGDDCYCPNEIDYDTYGEIIRITLGAGTYYIAPEGNDCVNHYILEVECHQYTYSPSDSPSVSPTTETNVPTMDPTEKTNAPTLSPTNATISPSNSPTMPPTTTTVLVEDTGDIGNGAQGWNAFMFVVVCVIQFFVK